ncbi:MAG: DUF2914 domain-containing protein [Deltaproteobacteria bacterium]|jgi:hypothetical protein|nr:DUF2914 domain-containing protein [Deltaproteobacteria bacterium]
MKFHPAVLALFATVTLVLSIQFPAVAMDEPGFAIKRMVIAENVVDREPVAVGETFTAATETVYCFLEAAAIEHDTTVHFVWYHEKTEVARVPLPLSAGKRWRTYSSKKLAGLKGDWTVELQEESGIILNSVSFTVR